MQLPGQEALGVGQLICHHPKRVRTFELILEAVIDFSQCKRKFINLIKHAYVVIFERKVTYSYVNDLLEQIDRSVEQVGLLLFFDQFDALHELSNMRVRQNVYQKLFGGMFRFENVLILFFSSFQIKFCSLIHWNCYKVFPSNIFDGHIQRMVQLGTVLSNALVWLP